ncbi:unnamed protein product [Closterium sp. Yama58-4]|nr:unnamed protein product [Closterium sp. Yama58-4]
MAQSAHTRVEAALGVQGVGEPAGSPWGFETSQSAHTRVEAALGVQGVGEAAGPPWPPDSLHRSARFQADGQQGEPSQQHVQPVNDGRLLRREGVLQLCRLLLLAAWAAACIAGAWGLAGDHRDLRDCADILAAGVALTPTTHSPPDATSAAPSSTSDSNNTSPNSAASSSRVGEWGHHRRYERRAGECWSRAELPCYAGINRRTRAGLFQEQQHSKENTDGFSSETAGQNEQQQHGMSEQLQVKLRQYHTYRRQCLHREPLGLLRSTLLAGKPTACRYLIYYHSSDGQGNRLLSLVSSFAYALLTDRVFLLSSKSGPAAVLCEPFEHGESWVLFGREEQLEEHHAQVLGLKVAREWRDVREGREKKGKKGGGRRRLVEGLLQRQEQWLGELGGERRLLQNISPNTPAPPSPPTAAAALPPPPSTALPPLPPPPPLAATVSTPLMFPPSMPPSLQSPPVPPPPPPPPTLPILRMPIPPLPTTALPPPPPPPTPPPAEAAAAARPPPPAAPPPPPPTPPPSFPPLPSPPPSETPAEGEDQVPPISSSSSSSSGGRGGDGSGDDYGLEELSGNVTEVMVASLNAALVHDLSEAVTGNMSAVRVSVGHDVTHAAMGVKLPPINTTSAASPALASPTAAPAPTSPDAANSSSSSGASDAHVHIVRLTIDEKQNNGDKAGVDRAIVDIYTLALFSDALVISEVSTFGYLCASLFGVPHTMFVSATCKRAPPEPCLHFPPGNERCPDGQAQVLEQVLAQDPHVPLMHCMDVSNGLTLKPLEGWEYGSRVG